MKNRIVRYHLPLQFWERTIPQANSLMAFHLAGFISNHIIQELRY